MLQSPIPAGSAASTPEEVLAESLLEAFGLPLLALLISALGRRVIAGAKFDKWESSAEIAMDASMIGATACGTIFVSPFLEQVLHHTASYATGAIFICFLFWVTLLGNRYDVKGRQVEPPFWVPGPVPSRILFPMGILRISPTILGCTIKAGGSAMITPLVSALAVSAAGVAATAALLSGFLSLIQRHFGPKQQEPEAEHGYHNN